MEELLELAKKFSEELKALKTIVAGLMNMSVEVDNDTIEKAFSAATIESCADGAKWKPGVRVETGMQVMHEERNYLCLQQHLTQIGWEPELCPALWVAMRETSDWTQPTSTNPYMKGDIVTYMKKTYESLIDNNVWSPTAYPQGWKEIL